MGILVFSGSMLCLVGSNHPHQGAGVGMGPPQRQLWKGEPQGAPPCCKPPVSYVSDCSWGEPLPFPRCTRCLQQAQLPLGQMFSLSQLQRKTYFSSGLDLALGANPTSAELLPEGDVAEGEQAARAVQASGGFLQASLLGRYFYSFCQFLGKLPHLLQSKLSGAFAACQGFWEQLLGVLCGK